MKTEERASFLERGETNMVSYRPRKRTWTNQKKGNQRRKNLGENEPFSTAERSERVENFLFRATREYTEAGIEQAIVAMRRLGANSPEPRKRAVRE